MWIPFLSVKGPELLGSYIGESEANVRDIFRQARESARNHNSTKDKKACILFFDELDSLAPRRGESASGGNVMDRVVATLFGELDKEHDIDDNTNPNITDEFDDNDDNNDDDHGDDDDYHHTHFPLNIFFIGATNRPDLLDPGLLRPGRFDRLVYLGLSPNDRFSILKAQVRKLRFEVVHQKQQQQPNHEENKEDPTDEMLKTIIDYLPTHVTGADLSTVASGALLRATDRLCQEADEELRQLQELYPNDDKITMDHVLESWDEERLKPILTLDDMIHAAKKVVPSVSATELARYELMSEKYRRTN